MCQCLVIKYNLGLTVTRINTCCVTELTDGHLKGEYKEITRIFTNTIKCIEKKGVVGAYTYIKDNQPIKYTVRTNDNPGGGRGHEMFFRDKLSYIEDRYIALALEMESRGNNVSWSLVQSVVEKAKEKVIDKRFWKDYTPTQEAYELNLKRRVEML